MLNDTSSQCSGIHVLEMSKLKAEVEQKGRFRQGQQMIIGGEQILSETELYKNELYLKVSE